MADEPLQVASALDLVVPHAPVGTGDDGTAAVGREGDLVGLTGGRLPVGPVRPCCPAGWRRSAMA